MSKKVWNEVSELNFCVTSNLDQIKTFSTTLEIIRFILKLYTRFITLLLIKKL